MKINCYKESCQLALEARLKQAPRPKSDDNLEVFCDHGLLDPRTHTVTFNKSPYGGAFAWRFRDDNSDKLLALSRKIGF